MPTNLKLSDIKAIQAEILSHTDFGLMLYYGGDGDGKDGSVYSEPEYARGILRHTILGLRTLQHRGNMVLKVSFLVNMSAQM